jgi:hypothetical protein
VLGIKNDDKRLNLKIQDSPIWEKYFDKEINMSDDFRIKIFDNQKLPLKLELLMKFAELRLFIINNDAHSLKHDS